MTTTVQHKNPTQSNRTALAPYNFVPLPPTPRTINLEELQKRLPHDRFVLEHNGAPVYSGWFEGAVTTETPCFIRGPYRDTDNPELKSTRDRPNFFSLDGGKTPRIPGSSLRGLFRSLVEIIGNARLNFVTDRRLVYRAVDTTRLGEQYRERIMEPDPGDPEHWFTPRVQAGYIRRGRDGEWYIQPAKKINGTTWCRISHKALSDLRDKLKPWPENADKDEQIKNARLIYVQPSTYDFQEVRGGFIRIRYARALRAAPAPGSGLHKAALIESGRINTKRSEAVIFEPDETVQEGNWLPLRYKDEDGNEVALDRDYRDQITDQQRMILGPSGALKDQQPVFYLLDDEGRVAFFGHTLMMRLPYRKSVLEHVPDSLRAEGKGDVDLAEALFGLTRKGSKKDGKDETLAFAGRVSFTDGVYAGNLPDPFEREIKPKVLSTPKPTTFQHYLCQPRPDDKAQLLNYDDDTALRGHKLYWHRGPTTIAQVEETDRDKLRHATQYTRIKAVKPGASFTFRIYFDNLRDFELGALAWVLQYAADTNYRLKLGMGKPHGLGAVRIAATLHLVDRRARYSRLFDDDGWSLAAAQSDGLAGQLVSRFKAWVTNGDAARFDAQPHIRELLAMLSWPGPNPEKTRYMEIERRLPDGRKVNEYRERPVLPHPTAVLGKAPATSSPSQPQPAAQPAAQPSAQAASAPEAQPAEWRTGILTESRPDRQYGVIRDEQTQKMHRFDTRVIQGNTPATKSRVQFQVQSDGRVIAVKKA